MSIQLTRDTLKSLLFMPPFKAVTERFIYMASFEDAMQIAACTILQAEKEGVIKDVAGKWSFLARRISFALRKEMRKIRRKVVCVGELPDVEDTREPVWDTFELIPESHREMVRLYFYTPRKSRGAVARKTFGWTCKQWTYRVQKVIKKMREKYDR